MFRLRSRDESLESTLKRIEHRVLEEVHLASWQRRAGLTAASVLSVTVLVTWVAGLGGNWLPLITSTLGAGAAVCSFVSLRRRRFKWCLAAAYLSGLSTVTGIGAFWWARTSGAVGALVASTGFAWVAAAVLTAVWVSVVITPVGRSQPDMRRPAPERKWGVRESGGTVTWPPPCAGPFPPDQK